MKKKITRNDKRSDAATARKMIVRLSRQNEFNGYWAFLVLQSLVFAVVLRYVYTFLDLLIWLSGVLLIFIVGLVYQGFEVVYIGKK